MNDWPQGEVKENANFNFGFDPPPVQMFKDKKPEENKNEMIKPRKVPQEEDSDDAKIPIEEEEPQIMMSQSPNRSQKA